MPVEAPGSGVVDYLLIMMAQDGGWPVPVGLGSCDEGAVNRARAAGAHIECGREVDGIEGGRSLSPQRTAVAANGAGSTGRAPGAGQHSLRRPKAPYRTQAIRCATMRLLRKTQDAEIPHA